MLSTRLHRLHCHLNGSDIMSRNGLAWCCKNWVLQIATDDISLDDLWALDLNKLDGWRCVKENTTGDIKELMSSDEGSDSNDSEDDL